MVLVIVFFLDPQLYVTDHLSMHTSLGCISRLVSWVSGCVLTSGLGVRLYHECVDISCVFSHVCLQNMMIKKHALELTTSFIIPLVCVHVYDCVHVCMCNLCM